MRKYRRNTLTGFHVVLSLVLMASGIRAQGLKPQSDPVAVVNGSSISLETYTRELALVRDRALREGKPIGAAELSKIREIVLAHIIGRELLYQESRKMGIRVDTGDVNARIASLKRDPDAGTAYQRALSEMDLTEEAVMVQIRRAMALQRLIDHQIVPKVTVTEREIRAFYEENPQYLVKPVSIRASHILVEVVPSADEAQWADVLRVISRVQERLAAGEDFALLARSFSEDPTAEKGGDLGYFGRGEMVKSFEDAAFVLNPGEVSDIVQTRFGYHLIKVWDRRPASVYDYEEIRDVIARELNRRRVEAEVTLYVKRLEANADVKRFLRE